MNWELVTPRTSLVKAQSVVRKRNVHFWKLPEQAFTLNVKSDTDSFSISIRQLLSDHTVLEGIQ